MIYYLLIYSVNISISSVCIRNSSLVNKIDLLGSKALASLDTYKINVCFRCPQTSTLLG